MPEQGQEAMNGFTEFLHEFRGMGVELVQRTVRLEVKVDRILQDQASMAGLATRITELENWFKAETARRNATGKLRGLAIGALASIAGGSGGAIVGHFWK